MLDCFCAAGCVHVWGLLISISDQHHTQLQSDGGTICNLSACEVCSKYNCCFLSGIFKSIYVNPISPWGLIRQHEWTGSLVPGVLLSASIREWKPDLSFAVPAQTQLQMFGGTDSAWSCEPGFPLLFVLIFVSAIVEMLICLHYCV